jgi:2-polyprenyl-3-methyl-5-hydroxy-6-metoxy-1,4-benzoquinol methylase
VVRSFSGLDRRQGIIAAGGTMSVFGVGAALLHMDTARIARALKGRWRDRTIANGPPRRREQAPFNRLYLVRDPWSLNCEREKFRFAETNRIILENFGHIGSLLEVGCGEGLQSNELLRICNHLHGIDVSSRAIRRARRQCPEATFEVGDIFGLSGTVPASGFDLVTACEVLYYTPDVATVLKRVSDLGRACLISYYNGAQEILNQHVGQIPGAQLTTITQQEYSWTIAWWRP